MSLKLFFGKKSGALNVSFWHLEQKCKIKLVSVSLSYHVIPQTHCFTHITHHRAFTITLGLTYGYKFGLLEQWDIFSFCQMSLWLCLKNHLVLLHFKPFLKVIKRKTYFWTKIKKKHFKILFGNYIAKSYRSAVIPIPKEVYSVFTNK